MWVHKKDYSTHKQKTWRNTAIVNKQSTIKIPKTTKIGENLSKGEWSKLLLRHK